MDYKKTTRAIKERIEELESFKDVLYQIQDTVCAIEKELSDIDASLPSDAELRAMPESAEKRQILDIIDLNFKAFDLVDDILGPPQDEVTGETAGTAYSPEARGANAVSLDEILARVAAEGKNKAS